MITATKNQKYIRLAFFEGENNFLYQVRVLTPKDGRGLVEIMDFVKKEMQEIWQLLFDKKKIAQTLGQDCKLKIEGFNYKMPTCKIRNLPKNLN
jgi:hypothetical protein